MKIYIWGTGRLTGRLLGDVLNVEDIEGFIDNNSNKRLYMEKPVLRPEEMLQKEYDAILVITLYSQEISRQSREIGLDESKMIYLYENYVMTDINADYQLAEKILGKPYADLIKNRYALVRKNDYLPISGRELEKEGYFGTDYIRVKTFEMIAEQLTADQVQGNIAEVGVFQGEFAQYMNLYFPNRRCYLFDTFEGFDIQEGKNEVERNHATEAFVNAYQETNEEIVKKKMLYQEQVEIRKGYFPDSLAGLEDTFAFVSIDVDFEESILACLEYFYPRVSEGGIIFIHDYNSKLQGVRSAVNRYERTKEIRLHKMPLCDTNGTLVILK